jgi:N-acetylmuramoyl-L-alanine amidase
MRSKYDCVRYNICLRVHNARRMAGVFGLLALATACGTDTSFDPASGPYGYDTSDYADIREAGLDNYEPVDRPDDIPVASLSLLNPTAEKWCPTGYSYDNGLQLCANGTDAIGPFPQAMVDNCVRFGGGAACQEDNWQKEFTAKLRGKGDCLLGTTRTASGLCSDGVSAYGPFSEAHVKNCQKAGGGKACSSLRWSLSFAEKLHPKDQPTLTLQGFKVALDSGHGGNPQGWEPGAMNPFNGLSEYKLNLDTASAVADTLRKQGATVSLFSYPTNFSGPSLSGKGARAKGHDIFVSIHYNAFNNSSQGSEVFTHNSLQTRSDTKLAFSILDRVMDRVWKGAPSRNRGVKAANLGVLRGASPVTEAAVLVEGFFIDHNEPAKAIEDRRALTAQGIAEGIANYWIGK